MRSLNPIRSKEGAFPWQRPALLLPPPWFRAEVLHYYFEGTTGIRCFEGTTGIRWRIRFIYIYMGSCNPLYLGFRVYPSYLQGTLQPLGVVGNVGEIRLKSDLRRRQVFVGITTEQKFHGAISLTPR